VRSTGGSGLPPSEDWSNISASDRFREFINGRVLLFFSLFFFFLKKSCEEKKNPAESKKNERKIGNFIRIILWAHFAGKKGNRTNIETFRGWKKKCQMGIEKDKISQVRVDRFPSLLPQTDG
jgi:hypothetical protein